MNPFDKGFLGHKELRSLTAMCAGVALLVGISLALSGNGALPGPSQAAATALGDQQGAPVGNGIPYVGKTYPADVLCWVNWSYVQYGTQQNPLCPGIGNSTWGSTYGNSDTFAVGIFSVDLGGGQGQSVYTTRTYASGGYMTTDLGPSEAGCNAVNVTDAGWECYDGQGGFTGPASWDCNQYTIPVGSSPGGGGPPGSPYECTYITQIAPSLSAPTSHTVGTAPTITAGAPINIEWSCLPSRTVSREQKTFGSCFFGCAGQWDYGTLYNVSLASSVSGSGPGFSPSGLTGTQTIIAPTTLGTYTYNLTCNGGTGTMPITLTVAPANAPTVAFTANGVAGDITVIPGQTAHLAASFSPAGSYTGSAINNFDNTATLTSQDASSPKTYDFNTPGNPAVPGDYLFWAVAKTSALGWANNFGKSLTIHVAAPSDICTDIPGTQSSVPSGCQTPTPNPGACIPPGYTYDASTNTCVPNASCANGLDYALYGPSCACPANRHQVGASCVPDNGSITEQLQANPARVRKGGTATLSWATQGMTSCGLSQNGTVFNGNAPLSSSNFTSPAVISATTFTLTCTDSSKTYTSTAQVTILPSYIEI